MCLHRRYRFVLLCLSIGFFSLLVACSNETAAKPEAITAPTRTASSSALHAKTPTPASPVSGAAHVPPSHNGVVIVSSTATSSSGGTTSPAGASSSTGTQSSASSTGTSSSNGVQASSSASSSSSGTLSSNPPAPTGTFTLALACSGANAQDGFQVNNSSVRACVYTSPGASLTINVSFCNGKSDTSGALQGTFTADAHGFYAWNWTPHTSCQSLSIWSASVSAKLNGQSATVSEASSSQGTPGNLPNGW